MFYVSQNEHFSESIDIRPSFSKTKPGSKRSAEKTSVKKPMKKKQNKMVIKIIFFPNDSINNLFFFIECIIQR